MRSRSWPAPEAEVGWAVGTVALCFLGTQLLSMVWAGLMLGAAYGTGEIPPLSDRSIWMLPAVSLGLWAGYFASPFLARRLAGRGSLADFDLRSTPVQFAIAVATGVGAQLVVLPALYWLLLRFVDGDPGRVAEDLMDAIDTPVEVAVIVVSVVVITPLIEEWFYRGMLLAALVRRFGPAAGSIVASVVFAAVHQEAILLPGLFVFAMMLAGLTIWTGRLGAAVVGGTVVSGTVVSGTVVGVVHWS